MADERLLAPIRRFWSPDEVAAAYQAIFSAYNARLEKVTVIISKATEGDSATGQVVIAGEDYLRWMDALEARMQELEAAASGDGPTLQNTDHANFGSRYVST